MKKYLLLPLLILGCFSDSDREPKEESSTSFFCAACETELAACKIENIASETEKMACEGEEIAENIENIALMIGFSNCWYEGAGCTYHEKNKSARLQCMEDMKTCYINLHEKIKGNKKQDE